MYTRHKYSDRLDHIPLIPDEDAYYSVKHDGANYFLKYDDEGNASFISRRVGVDGTNPDRSAKVPHLAKKMPEFAGHTFNVELIHTGLTPDGKDNHAKVSGLLNSLPPRSLEEQRKFGPIRAKVFDYTSDNNISYAQKLDKIHSLVKAFGDHSIFSMPEAVIGHKEGAKLQARLKANRAEGVVISNLRGPDVRPRIKVKNLNTYNFKVIGITQEFDIHGVAKNSAGALLLADANGTHVGNVGTGFTKEEREDIWKNPSKWINKPVQIIAMDPTATKLRHAVYNGDADGDIDLLK